MIFGKRIYRDFDRTLFIVVIALCLIGILAIYSATQSRNLVWSESYVARQASWMFLGTILIFAVIAISYQKFIDLAYMLYGINILLLILVLTIGHVRLGAQRWFSIGGFAFQPSEFIKLNLILALSCYAGQREGAMSEPRNVIASFFIFFVPFVLVLFQPDLGSALMLLPIFLSILLVSGTDIKYIISIIALGALSLPVFWHMLRDYQKQRLLVFINPNIDPLGAGYTIIQSKIAVGSGGLFGKGYLGGTQNQLNFLPERHTDFIFSVIGEEWGLIGTIAVLALYFLIAKKAFAIASLTSDAYGKSIATGVGVMIGLQSAINIGMTIGIMPVVGIPLPLISYGGSSLIATMIAVGLLLNVSMRRSTF